ncbi:SubName: Full=Uncharacterized protein {ECO:0000313/EMBL:CCA75892.1} [Serendipita indica DSM 11827]|uniref:Uncharacterized protein n=1 Tax=Serendipita indica (strain DSM 11827) TaxID=1109443 RepID=G4TX49_SERID|nr:SubName: Full=Uncharacterized protein {ECO:0000313/EMBL:CCA75892.1} [Serendipita indica DSM 11827]CCA75892.1 hypothetical protein PIIN_09888 [Serendipita indica DSM 11827]
MSTPSQRVPVELWEHILLDVVYELFLLDLEHVGDVDQKSLSRRFRHEDAADAALTYERGRITLMLVCKAWKTFVDRTTGGWKEADSRSWDFPLRLLLATRIDLACTAPFKPAYLLGIEHQARILTIRTTTVSIDDLLVTYGASFPHVSTLDLRHASSVLSPTGGMSAPNGFFATLATLFPHLQTLFVEVPASDTTSDILSLPNLTRLSYVVVGQSRLSDGKRAAALALWELPKLQHLDIQPVGSTCDWSLVTDGLRAWGSELKTLCFDARFPCPTGIEIGREDWTACKRLIYTDHGRNVVRIGRTKEAKQILIPSSHPFRAFQRLVCV